MINVRNNQTGRKTIDIDLNESISISLRDEQYDQLISALEISMAEKIISYDKRSERVEKRSEENIQFIKEIRNVFYDNHGSVFLKRDLKEINTEILDDILEKYSSLLGFE